MERSPGLQAESVDEKSNRFALRIELGKVRIVGWRDYEVVSNLAFNTNRRSLSPRSGESIKPGVEAKRNPRSTNLFLPLQPIATVVEVERLMGSLSIPIEQELNP